MKKLWNKLAKKNSKYYINSDYGQGITEEEFNNSGVHDYLKFIVNDPLIGIRNLGPILDLGCGTGRMTGFMSYTFPSVVGTDISGEMIKKAIKNNDDESVKFVETDGYTLPLDDNSFKFVFSYLVFQHMKTKEMVESNFKEVFRVLKPGGIFKVRIRTDEVRQDKWWSGVAYTEQSIGLLIKKMGYEILRTEAVESCGLWLWLKKPQ